MQHDLSMNPINQKHFTIRGPNEGGFQGGRYHGTFPFKHTFLSKIMILGRMVFPTDYPFKPPDIYFLTPNGRFEIGKKICLSITSFHQEEWRPGLYSSILFIISLFLHTSLHLPIILNQHGDLEQR